MEKTLLNDATSMDECPTPGYMLNDIVKSSISSLNNTQKLLEFLLLRIAKNNPNVKYKCLLIIKHLCRNGRLEFKQEIGKNISSIKECLNYTGVPDPLRGDEPYRKVREAAKETLEAIYDGMAPVHISVLASSNKIQGIGNAEEYQAATTSSPKVAAVSMMKTGSFFTFKSLSNTTETTNSNYIDLNEKPIAVAPSIPSTANTTANNSPLTVNVSLPVSELPQENEKVLTTTSSWLQRATSVGSYKNSSSPDSKKLLHEEYTTNVGPNSLLNATPGYDGVAFVERSNEGSKVEMTAASDGQYEKTMIESLCEPGGLKSVPPEDKLDQFIIAAATLSEETVGSCLLELLNNDAWQTRTKALIVISKLVSNKTLVNHGKWWSIRRDEVNSLQSDSKAGVRTQALKTFRTIVDMANKMKYPVELTTHVPVNDAHNSSVSHTTMNLLGDSIDMFAGMAIGSGPTETITEINNSDLFQGLSAINLKPNSNLCTPNTTSTDMFSGLTFGIIEPVSIFAGINESKVSSTTIETNNVMKNQNSKSLNCFDFLDLQPVTTPNHFQNQTTLLMTPNASTSQLQHDPFDFQLLPPPPPVPTFPSYGMPVNNNSSFSFVNIHSQSQPSYNSYNNYNYNMPVNQQPELL
eukprot:gene6051-8332_t